MIESIKAYTTADSHRILDEIAVIEICNDGNSAMHRYRQLHAQFPLREFYFVHTSQANLDIREQHWVGIRRDHRAVIEG